MKTDLQFWLHTTQHWKRLLRLGAFVQYNNARSRLIAEIRTAERKLGRQYRHLPKAGIWQGVQL